MHGPPELPQHSPELVLIGTMIAVLEPEFPGLTARMQLVLAEDFTRTKVVQMRPPAEKPALRVAQRQAAGWLDRAAWVIAGRRRAESESETA